MRKLCIYLLMMMIVQNLSAQGNIYLHDPVTGKAYREIEYSEIKGNAFLFDGWLAGTARSAQGTYKNIKLKYDANLHEPLFLANGQAYFFDEQILEFTINLGDGKVRTFIHQQLVDGAQKKGYYEILAEFNNNQLLKHVAKPIIETTEYGAPGSFKTYAEKITYFTFINKQLRTVKLNQKDFLATSKQLKLNKEQLASLQQLDAKEEWAWKALFGMQQ